MFRYACALLPVILQFIFVREVSSTLCDKEEAVFDTTHFICPGTYDSRDLMYCCGPKKWRYCCSYEEYDSGFNNTITISTIGIIVCVLVTSVVVVIIIVVVSCFCCNGCLLTQNRNRRENTTYTASQPTTTTATATAHYSAQPPYPIQPFPTGNPHPPAAISSTAVPQPSSDILNPGKPPEFTKHSPTPPISRPIGWLVSRRQPPPYQNPPPYPINDQPPYPINNQPPYPINDPPPYNP